ncbi:MAG: hypothetical protein JXQ80_06510 [Bacteroidales bacterium]|nr:hypothetical protein [Bacteroidales bacterium]
MIKQNEDNSLSKTGWESPNLIILSFKHTLGGGSPSDVEEEEYDPGSLEE